MKVSAIAGALGIAAGAASAATASFDFGCDPSGGIACDSASESSDNILSLPDSFSLTSGGLTVTARARFFETGTMIDPVTNLLTVAPVSDAARIARFPTGAGVFSSIPDSHKIDGAFNNDFVQLSFSEAVSMTSIAFGSVASGSLFRYVYDVNGDGTIGVGDFLSDANTVPGLFSDFTDITSDVWGVAAFGAGDAFKLRSATVSFADAVPAVPLPAAGWLLLAGIGGLFGLRRRAA